MIKKPLLWIEILFINISFAYKEISVADLSSNRPITVNETNYEIPEGFTYDPQSWQAYRNLDISIQQIIECIETRNNQQTKALSYTTKKTLNHKNEYLVIHFPSLISSKGVNTNYLSFMWKKKKYSDLNEMEKRIANFYNAQYNNKLKFLYPYSNPNTDPWAIKIGKQLHATIWVNTKIKIKPSQVEPKDSFLILDPKEEKYEINLLIDENKQVLAKRINGITIFRDK